jgi:hypothetical protein
MESNGDGSSPQDAAWSKAICVRRTSFVNVGFSFSSLVWKSRNAVIQGETKEDAVAKNNEEQALTPQELEEQNGEELPDREVMSLINPGVDGTPTVGFEPLPPEVD